MPRKSNIQVGNRYGRLVVESKGESKSWGLTRWNCICDCGGRKVAPSNLLNHSPEPNCGCLDSEKRKVANLKHGHHSDGKPSATYNSWKCMKQRCLNPKDQAYENYGGRGISICERWLSFDSFLEDMGECPDGKTLERRDVDGNYEPSNCIWANNETQNNNRRGLVKAVIDGVLMTKAQAARHWNQPRHRINKIFDELVSKQNRG